MLSTRMQPRSLVMAGALVFALTIVSHALSAAPTVWLMSFTIEDLAVSHDDVGPEYQDYRLEGGDHCVEATLSGGLFIRFNRKLDGDAGTQYCGLSPGLPRPRQYAVTIPDATACQELSDNGYPTGPGAPCVISDTDNPRIRITNDIYGKRTTRTPVAFLTKWYDAARTSYEVRTETDATVEPDGPDTRIVTYSGSARLWRFRAGEKAKAVADAFPLPFQMTFTRHVPQ
jgi:hypothetical protein